MKRLVADKSAWLGSDAKAGI